MVIINDNKKQLYKLESQAKWVIFIFALLSLFIVFGNNIRYAESEKGIAKEPEKVIAIDESIELIEIKEHIYEKEYERKCEKVEKEKERQRVATEAKRERNNSSKGLNISSKEATKVSSRGSVSSSAISLLERIVEAEAGTESLEGRIAVVNVILNRVSHKGFPNNVKGVIYQRKQFESVSNGMVNRKIPSKKTKEAVQIALQGRQIVSKGVLYFYNPKHTGKGNWIRSRAIEKRIGNHLFCR